ncbi:unnamed protein product [Rotaria sp. Silwood1]|nr:unnamed protein product [Rotaria sp. Silwood1]
MGKLDLAEQYYSRLLQEIPPNDPSLRSVYADLGQIASQQGNYDKSVRWLQESLKIKEQAAASNSPKNELSLLDGIRCPKIVSFYGACTETGKYTLVMEYMSLGSLFKILHKDNLILTWPERLSIAFQTASGISYLHQLPEPILHRDIKSLNFLIERAYEGYTVKVCDFGLARTRNETTRYTTFNSTLTYTLPWTAPEILLLEGYADKSDIYSLGVVFWELASRRIPYYEYKNDVIRASVLAGDRLKIPESTPSRFERLSNDAGHNSQLIDPIALIWSK